MRTANHAIARPHRYEAVVMAASVGGVAALQKLLSGLPADFPLPIAIVQHRTTRPPLMLARVLGRHTSLKVKTATQGEHLLAGTVYLAPPDLHMTLRADQSVAFTDGRKIRHLRSSANPLFESAAEALGGRVIAVVLTGYDHDGTDGVQAVKHRGGMVLAQDQSTAESFGMPSSAIATGCVDHVLPLPQIAPELIRLARLRRDPDEHRSIETARVDEHQSAAASSR
jgi:two-component system, chemotaxis family, protein-glutamate methylesterase/glutaminase